MYIPEGMEPERARRKYIAEDWQRVMNENPIMEKQGQWKRLYYKFLDNHK